MSARLKACVDRATVVPLSVQRALAEPARPLDRPYLTEIEGRFGRDFSDVRVHTGAEAVRSAEALDAQAYTVGSAIVFGRSRFQPGSPAGNRLLAHELAHVVQQRDATSRLPTISGPGDESERAAERASRDASPRMSRAAAVPAIQRQPVGTPDAPTGLPDKPAGDRATEKEIEDSLTDFLTRVLNAQPGRYLRPSPVIWHALMILAGPGARLPIGSFLARKDFPGSPAEFAREARKHLPIAIPRSRLRELDPIPSAPSVNGGPASVGEAIGGLADKLVGPLIKVLPIGEDLKKALIEAARSAVAEGLIAIADKVIGEKPLDAATKRALHSAIDNAIQQKPAAPARDTPNDTHLREQAPAAGPPAPRAEGEKVTQGPKIDAPGTPSPYKAEEAMPERWADAARVIASLDDDALIPQSARGKPLANSFNKARDFARELTGLLDAAQSARRFTVEILIKPAYAQVDDLQDVFDTISGIAVRLANGLPHRSSAVGQVIVVVEGRPMVRRVIKLH